MEVQGDRGIQEQEQEQGQENNYEGIHV